MTSPREIRFGVVGSGWRAGCFLQTAALLGERCAAVGIAGRNPATREALAARWKIPAFADARELAKNGAEFLFVALPSDVSALLDLASIGLPLLVETPPAPTVEELERLWSETQRTGARIQVAEQYWLHPMQQARLGAIEAGFIGSPTYAHVSVNHGYHNISLIRKYLGVGFESAKISAAAFSSPIVGGPGRAGPPTVESIDGVEQALGVFDFGGGKRGLFDFEANQHRSWIRSSRVVVRGERGELADGRVSYLEDFRSPVFGELSRVQTGGDGDFEDYHLKGVMLGDRWLYRNRFAPARLSDEEISQAACLEAMAEYSATGKPFYSLAEASQDQYLAILLRLSIESGEPRVSETRPWARG